MTLLFRTLCLGLVATLLSVSSFAEQGQRTQQRRENQEKQDKTVQKPVLELGAGFGVLAAPDYPGADEQTLLALPFPYFVYRGERLRAGRDGIKGLLYTGEVLRLDISVGASLPVDSEDNSARQGMDDLPPSLELGPSLDWRLLDDEQNDVHVKFRLRALLAADDGRINHEGWVLNPMLNWDHRLNDQWQLNSRLMTFWGDAHYHDFFHCVDGDDVTPTRPAYRGQSGYGGSAVALGARWRPAPDWQVFARVSAYDFGGASFDDGPLFESDQALYFSLAITYIFWKSERQISINSELEPVEP